jgi:hypothetical protein
LLWGRSDEGEGERMPRAGALGQDSARPWATLSGENSTS